jgi:Ser/Thr protein kinase RdoA (MazF antagonist)
VISKAPTQHPYAALTPDRVLDALDTVGVHGNGRLQALNSYENRVYLIYRDDLPHVVAKFYRPARWSNAQILEEHAYTAELELAEIPVVAPLLLNDTTLHFDADFAFAVYPLRPGRAPEIDSAEVLTRLGGFIGRIHAVGKRRAFTARRALSVETFGDEPLRYIIDSQILPNTLSTLYITAVKEALTEVRKAFAHGTQTLRLHGDCHLGNVLWNEGPSFVDFDDAVQGRPRRDAAAVV